MFYFEWVSVQVTADQSAAALIKTIFRNLIRVVSIKVKVCSDSDSTVPQTMWGLLLLQKG